MRPLHPNLFSSASVRIVTPDSFHASMLADRYASARLAQDTRSWERPTIQSADVWLASCWQDVRYSIADIPVLLSPWQEILLWEEVIEAEGGDLLDVEATAQLARRAATAIAEWHIPLAAAEWSDNADALRFRDWCVRFRSLCSQRGFTTKADLWELLPEWIARGVYRPGKTAFWGFQVQPPALRKLLNALGSLATVAEGDHVREPGIAAVTVCDNFEQEMEYAARWARALFDSDSRQSVAVFVPDLLTHRSLVERTFKRVFHPSLALRFPPRNTASSVFHIGAARPLDQHPLIASALLLLELGKRQIAIADAGTILRCPFLSGAAAERSGRAQADLLLRDGRELEVSLRQMQRASGNCPLLTPVFDKLAQLCQGCPIRQDLPSWSEFMGALLQIVGWPGDGPLTADEEEEMESWSSALLTLGTLGMVSGSVSGSVSYRGALAHLRRILSGPGIEIGDWSSPIQVLDIATAAGLDFDRAFAVGLSEELWPTPRAASSLIPLQLQRACNVPCSSSQSVQEEQQRAASALFSSAPILAGTYSAGRLSPFAEPYVQESLEPLPQWTGRLPRQSFKAAALEEICDGKAPIYRMAEEARGGTGIIKSQSLCPFRAFAEYRLNAAFPDDACFGFDHLQRGGFLHRALEWVWQVLQTQERLLSLTEPELRAVIHEAVAKAVAQNGDSQFHQQAAEVERQRVSELLLDWLTGIESTRTQPFAVEKIEGERTFEIGGLRIRLRIDRIDRLENGRLILIDYKSGEPSRKSLEGNRPKEPQLLVYAASLGREVDGIFFGQLKPRNLKAVGYSREQHFSGKATGVLREKWDGFLEASQENVEHLAREFAEGHAILHPAKGACEYCHISPLCRIQETANAETEMQGDEGD